MATGGTITVSGNYRIHTFTANDDFVNERARNVEVLLIGGGGGGGNTVGAGGGGGGYINNASVSLGSGTFGVVIGGGGAGGVDRNTDGSNGVASTFNALSATGGGGGGSYSSGAGANGGSGGGGAPGSAGGTGSIGGDGGAGDGDTASGGGGGAGGVGEAGIDESDSGDGGNGYTSTISGSSVNYAGGGGGGAYQQGGRTTAGAGTDGGGNGGAAGVGTAGTANTGGGGGGGGYTGTDFAGGVGGTGVVIIRYLIVNTKSLDLENGSSQCAYIIDANQTGLDITGDISIEAWVNFESLPANGQTMAFVSKYAAAPNKSYLFSLFNSNGEYRLIISYSGDGTNETQVYTVITPVVGVWYHYAVATDVSAKTADFYVDSVANGTAGTAGTQTAIVNAAADFIVGAFNSGASPNGELDGLIDDVRVWSDIRTQLEISTNMMNELVGDEAGLVGYWKLNDDYLDQTSNDNDLTASGSPVFSVTVPFDSVLTTILLTSGTSFTTPADWNSASNTIEVIGAGGGAANNGSSGGGGGGYSILSNHSMSGSIAYVVGTAALATAGGDTYFDGANLAASNVGAEGGTNGTTTAGAGGASANGTGDTSYSGGTGGARSPDTASGGGGGGAAGDTGAGAVGSVGIDAGAGGAGGTGNNGVGGSGGAGGAANTPGKIGVVGNELNSVGSGGGGGGGGYGTGGGGSGAGWGGWGGIFGGGGGGGGYQDATSTNTAGGWGMVLIVYAPSTTALRDVLSPGIIPFLR